MVLHLGILQVEYYEVSEVMEKTISVLNTSAVDGIHRIFLLVVHLDKRSFLAIAQGGDIRKIRPLSQPRESTGSN
jgi:hypothetical protein